METIADLIASGGKLFINCGECRANRIVLQTEEIGQRYKPETRLDRIRFISPCSKCGTKGFQIFVDWG